VCQSLKLGHYSPICSHPWPIYGPLEGREAKEAKEARPGLRLGEGVETEALLDGRAVAKSVSGIVGGVTMKRNELSNWITRNFEVDGVKWHL